MISFVVTTILVALATWLTGDWWWVMLVPGLWFVVVRSDVWPAARAGAAASGLVWLCGSLWMWFWGGADLVAPRLSKTMYLPWPFLLVLVTVFIAMVCGGLAAAAGASLRAALTPTAKISSQN